ncbi:MAG: ribonuclease P protein component [Bacteroidaceae bacterium]|nr:ribonuclease P protein component [Bacteroidaceae bacterium]
MPISKSRTMPRANSLPKSQRLTGRTAVSQLFQNGNSRSITCHPIRAVYRPNDQLCHRMLATASKHHFRHAVDRNRVKRQIREAYRLNKHILQDMGTHLDIAFIWLSNHHKDSQVVASSIQNILNKIYTTTCISSGQS